MNKEEKGGAKIDIELDHTVAEGKYANLVVINHSSSEFILDFISLMPGSPKAKVKSRVILTPVHAKKLLQALADNVNKFESQFGEIDTNKGGNVPPFNFNTPKAKA